MITTMDRNAAKVLSAAVEAALKQVEAAHGVRVTMKGGRFDPVAGTFVPKVEIKLAGAAGVSANKAVWDMNCWRFGLKPDDFGKVFRASGVVFKIVDIKPSRRKHPVVAERETDGKRFGFAADNALRALLS